MQYATAVKFQFMLPYGYFYCYKKLNLKCT